MHKFFIASYFVFGIGNCLMAHAATEWYLSLLRIILAIFFFWITLDFIEEEYNLK